MVLALLVATTLALAWVNGANDNLKPVATLYGSGTLSWRQAVGVATAAQLAGSAASVWLAGALLTAFRGKGLVPDAAVADPSFLAAVGLGAAGTVLAATRLGLPVSTTHALIGGLVGAGLARAPGGLAWGRLGAVYLVPLLATPCLAVVAAGALYPVARRARVRLGVTERTCVCAGTSVVPAGADGAAAARVEVAVGERDGCARRYGGTVLGVGAQEAVDGLHLLSGVSLGFARGLNDTPKVLALLVAAAGAGIPVRASLLAVAGAMAAGGALHARRVADTLGHRITGMNRGQGLLANAVASALVIGASLWGAPVSTTHVATGAIFGIGAHTGRADPRVIAEVVLAWVLTLPVAGVVAFACAAWVG